MDPEAAQTTVRGPLMPGALRNWSANASDDISSSSLPYGPDDLHPSTLVASTFLLVAVFLVGTVGNTVIFLSAFQSWGKKLRTGFDLLIFDLTVCDFIACAVVTPAFTVCLFRDPAPSLAKPFCNVFVFFSTTCTFMSLSTLVAIALHRLTMVKSQAKRPISWRGAVLVLAGYQRTTRLEAIGDGDLELNRNKSSHQDRMGMDDVPEPSRVDRAVGPSYTHGRSQRTPCGARLTGRLRPRWEISTDLKRSISKSRRDSYIVPTDSRADGPTQLG
ncbi:PREDICTED: probable G-protein coupled receptor 75 [Branchiostoma belcheri]|uniref:Probable G-protein coupled receptor 75 n=1 Tax=Branchiostoma belcheri TaxID=7741 RepID=A0A6P4YMG7_BRABE|nr:PREDICTED: probable G-protein coupled receptor 75 [Branchiostoma belcheri]